MVRVGSLRDQMLISSKWKDNKTNMTAQEQIHAIFREVKKLNKRKDKIYSKLMTEVEQFGICLIDFQMAREEEQQYLEKYFETEIAPLISPTVVGKRQPFPFCATRKSTRLLYWRQETERNVLELFHAQIICWSV